VTNGGAVLRPAVPPPVRVRQNINSLPANDPIVVFYGRAVDAMKARPISDPLSWRYQAAIHDYPFPDTTLAQRQILPGNQNRDPFAASTDTLPADRGTFWRQCQHGSWFFLPWHRIYLHHFEKIVADQVALLGGPRDWALPYWDWKGPEGVGRIPTALRDPKVGGLASLFVKEREPDANNGAVFADSVAEVDINFNCLKPSVFMGNGRFGGPPVRRHGGEGPPEPPVPPALNGSGVLEATPHGAMHVAVGRPPDGWMRSFVKAPLDPIFWLHHCNIDRLWEVWIQRKSGNKNPDDKAWLDASFSFHDRTRGDGTMTTRQVLNTRKPPLSYEYDDTSDPLGGA
jgi:tyrosinase